MELLRCLVVDDEELERELIAQYLEGVAACDMATDGGEAVAKFQASLETDSRYDLIILDILMPGMDGYEAGKAIRRMEKERGITLPGQVKIVVLSSLNTPYDVMQSFMTTQSAAHLVKPVEPAKLRETLGKLGLRRKAS